MRSWQLQELGGCRKSTRKSAQMQTQTIDETKGCQQRGIAKARKFQSVANKTERENEQSTAVKAEYGCAG